MSLNESREAFGARVTSMSVSDSMAAWQLTIHSKLHVTAKGNFVAALYGGQRRLWASVDFCSEKGLLQD